MITADDILTSSGRHPERPQLWPPNRSMLTDAGILSQQVNRVLLAFYSRKVGKSSNLECVDETRYVSSGYRPPAVNEVTPGAAPNSHHQICEAVDITDHDGELALFVLANLPLLAYLELWIEDTRWTRTIAPGESEKIPNGQQGWVHFQLVAPASGNRVFIPFPGDPP